MQQRGLVWHRHDLDVVGLEVVGLLQAKHNLAVALGLAKGARVRAHLNDRALVGRGKDVDVEGHDLDVQGQEAKGRVLRGLGPRAQVRDVDDHLDIAGRLLLVDGHQADVVEVEPPAADHVLVDHEAHDGAEAGLVQRKARAGRVGAVGLGAHDGRAARDEKGLGDGDAQEGLGLGVEADEAAPRDRVDARDDASGRRGHVDDAGLEARREARGRAVGKGAAAAVAPALGAVPRLEPSAHGVVEVRAQRVARRADLPPRAVRHGHVEVAREALDDGADAFPVGQPSEAPVARVDARRRGVVPQTDVETLHRERVAAQPGPLRRGAGVDVRVDGRVDVVATALRRPLELRLSSVQRAPFGLELPQRVDVAHRARVDDVFRREVVDRRVARRDERLPRGRERRRASRRRELALDRGQHRRELGGVRRRVDARHALALGLDVAARHAELPLRGSYAIQQSSSIDHGGRSSWVDLGLNVSKSTWIEGATETKVTSVRALLDAATPWMPVLGLEVVRFDRGSEGPCDGSASSTTAPRTRKPSVGAQSVALAPVLLVVSGAVPGVSSLNGQALGFRRTLWVHTSGVHCSHYYTSVSMREKVPFANDCCLCLYLKTPTRTNEAFANGTFP